METGKANNIQAKSFNTDLYEKYHLSVQIGLTHFSYCIINIDTTNVEYFKEFFVNDNILDIIKEEEILKLNFSSSRVALTNLPYTLIPNELTVKEGSKEILELTTEVYETIESDELTSIDATLFYTIPKNINDLIFTFFPNADKKAQQSILIEQFSRFENNKENAYLYISEKVLNITIFRKGKLIFNNSFSFETKEDILYFTLFAFEQLKIDAEIVETKLYGNIIKEDENYQLLYDYIRNIGFGSRPKNLKFSSIFNDFKDYQFYGLFS